MAVIDLDTMQIRRPLPPLIRKSLQERGVSDNDIVVSTNTDLDIAGEYSERWLVVTREHVLVYMIEEEEGEALLIREVPIAKIESARTDSRVGSGFLEAKTTDEIYEELIRFSNKNSEKFGKVANKIRTLAAGKQVVVRPEEEAELVQGRCQKCGIRLPDRSMTVCPKCMKRGMVFMRFLGMTKAYWPLAAIAMALVVTTILFSLIPPMLTRILIDFVFERASAKDLPTWFRWLSDLFGAETHRGWLYVVVGTLAATNAIMMFIGWARERLASWINNRLGFDLRREVFQKMEDLAVRYHDKHPVGSLMTRCHQDVETLQSFINQLTGGFGYQMILVVSVGVMMFTISWKLALIACLPAPLVMTLTILFHRRVIPKWSKYWTTRSDLSNILHASLSGIRAVKAFAQEKREGERLNRYSARFQNAGLSVGYANAVFYPIMFFVFQLGSYFIWLIGGFVVIESLDVPQAGSTLTKGQLIQLITYLGMFYGPLNSLTQMSAWFTSFTTQAHRVFEVLDHEPEITEGPDAVEMQLQGSISFKNVTFGYDPHIPVLHDVSFDVHPGEMIGVVGHSGSGKSTMVNLIMRFYDVKDGTVTIDNIDIRKIRKTCLRRQIGLVPQDPYLFGGTISENIAYGNPSVAPELVLDAALAANAHMFITRIHDGYDTRLGERGSGLSGGERQRVAIARALLYNPRVLILDEATSSVDTIAEREIQKALESLSLGRTTIAVAHRLSTLRNCDRILVFEEGVIREQGTHEELVALKGIYKKLVDIQTQLTSDRETSFDSLKAIETIEKAEEAKEAAVKEKKERVPPGPVPRIRYLDVKQLHIYPLDQGGMHVSYMDEEYDFVHAYRCFPISHPSEFVALWTGASALEHRQIGMIRRMKELSPSSLLAVEHELAKRYFIHYIQKINAITDELGFLYWNVETDKGHMEFMTRRWDRSTVAEGGPNGRIILDVDYNRYEIENLDALDEDSRETFDKYIYW